MMPLDELGLMLGGIQGEIKGLRESSDDLKGLLDRRFQSHGERVGRLEAKLDLEMAKVNARIDTHLDKSGSGNGNGIKRAALQYGAPVGGGAIALALIQWLYDMFRQ